MKREPNFLHPDSRQLLELSTACANLALAIEMEVSL
jgi:hypothetical protein